MRNIDFVKLCTQTFFIILVFGSGGIGSVSAKEQNRISSQPMKTCSIQASAGPGGRIDPSGLVTVPVPSIKSFSIQAANGYAIADVLVDGRSQGTISSYTFQIGSTRKHTISATFKPMVPPVPTGLSALSTGSDCIVLSWDAPTGATGYEVLVDGEIKASPSSIFPHFALAPGSTHTYQVRALNALGVSPWSATLSVKTLVGTGLDLYVYSDLANDLPARTEFFNFAQQKGIRRVYLEFVDLMRSSPETLSEFIGEARSHGIGVVLLTGDASWVQPEKQATALAIAKEAAIFADELRARKHAAPEAIQFDVEPYLLEEWDKDMNWIANQYLDLLRGLHSTLKGHLALTVAIPFWFDNRQVTRDSRTRPLSEWTIDATDGTVMMDYRESASQIVSLAASELAYASQQGKPLVLAVNMKDEGEELEYITFHEEGETVMREQLAIAEPQLLPYDAFAGFGVFYYEAWRDVLSGFRAHQPNPESTLESNPSPE